MGLITQTEHKTGITTRYARVAAMRLRRRDVMVSMEHFVDKDLRGAGALPVERDTMHIGVDEDAYPALMWLAYRLAKGRVADAQDDIEPGQRGIESVLRMLTDDELAWAPEAIGDEMNRRQTQVLPFDAQSDETNEEGTI